MGQLGMGLTRRALAMLGCMIFSAPAIAQITHNGGTYSAPTIVGGTATKTAVDGATVGGLSLASRFQGLTPGGPGGLAQLDSNGFIIGSQYGDITGATLGGKDLATLVASFSPLSDLAQANVTVSTVVQKLGPYLTGLNLLASQAISGTSPSTQIINSPLQILGDLFAPVLASGSTTPRALSDRFSDVVNVRDYGAKCDGVTDDLAAFNSAFSAALIPAGAEIIIPAGVCRFSASWAGTEAAGDAITVEGAGSAQTVLLFDAAATKGVSVSLTTPTSYFSIRHLDIRRNSTTAQAGTGLTIAATVSSAASVSDITDVHIDGTARGGAWALGALLNNLGTPTLHAISIILPDGGGNAAAGTGIQISGTNSVFTTDAKISDAIIQGGHIGLLVTGTAQGVFWSNSEAIGNDIGINWTDVSGNSDAPELLMVSNSHFNNWVAGIKTDFLNQITVSGNLFYHFGSAAGYRAIDAEDNQEVTITANLFNGNGNTNEIPIRLANSSLDTISGNVMIYYGGQCMDLGTNIQALTATGNSCSGVSSPGILSDSTHTSNVFASNVLNGVPTPAAASGSTGSVSIAPTGQPITSGSTATMLVTSNLLVVNKTTGSATTVTLPANPVPWQPYTIKDRKGDANTNPITIVPASGTLETGSSFILTVPFGAVTFEFDGTNWNIL